MGTVQPRDATGPLAENVTFKVTDRAGSAYVLRLHRPGYHTLDELVSERAWIRGLAEAGIDVPTGLPARDGRCGNCTACRESIADNRILSTSSDPRNPGTPSGEAMATACLDAFLSTPDFPD